MEEAGDDIEQLVERALAFIDPGDYDRGRARGVLRRAAQRRGEHIRGFEIVIAANLKVAFDELGAECALQIFEREELVQLERNIQLLARLVNPDVPLYILQELAEHAAGFRGHLETNRESLIEHGTATARFRDCPWLERRLGHLYFLRVPLIGPEQRKDSLGRLRPDHWEERAAVGARRHDPATRRIDLDPADADRLVNGRASLLDLKMRILRQAELALRAGDAEGFWDGCRAELTKSLTRDEAEFYFRQDRFYRDVDARAKHVGGPEPGVVGSLTLPGGLSDLLDVAGHFECELRFRALHDTKQELLAVAEQLGLPSWRAPLGESYLAVLDCPWRAAIDEVLIRCAAREADPRPWRFWDDYRRRVNRTIEEDLEQDVVFRTTIKRRHREQYVSYGQAVLEMAKSVLSSTGSLPELQLPNSDQASQLADNTIRRAGDCWEIRFERETVPLPDLVGCVYVGHLIARQGQELWASELMLLAYPPPELGPPSDEEEEDGIAEPEPDDGEDALPVIENESRSRCGRRIRDLAAKIKQVEAAGESPRLTALKDDLAALKDYLRKSTDKRGRTRRTGGYRSKATKSVRSSIDYALKKLSYRYPTLAAHLDDSIKRRSLFFYQPESSRIRPV